MEPLIFEPVYRQYLWGGRRLETVLNKSLGNGPRYAESWEVVDHGDDQSVVADGPLAGKTLHTLVIQNGRELLGERHADFSSFPLLFKYLDAQQVLSLQVHPNDAQGAELDPPDLGKTEAWVILDTTPDATVYAGLRAGVTRAELAAALSAGAGAELMHQFHPRVGDCVFVPAGIPHALGAGLLVAEIQQASNTTFRLHDWNRTDADGNPRPLHIKQGLDVIDYERGPVDPVAPIAIGQDRERLVECDKFVLDRLRLDDECEIGADQRFHILSVLDGAIDLSWDGGSRTLARGQTTLVPAITTVRIRPCQDPVTLLDMRLP